VTLLEIVRRRRRLRTIGIDDGPFARGQRARVLVVGAVYSAAQFEGLLATSVRGDGCNATARLVAMIGGSKFHAQLHLVLLDGITLGGFNVVDLPRLADGIGLPCVAVMRRLPDLAAVNRALAHLPRAAWRRQLIDRAGEIHSAGPVRFQVAGAEPAAAREAILASAVHGHVPECLRAAHLIASGIVTGESGHRA
jgi:uncharacterized protein